MIIPSFDHSRRRFLTFLAGSPYVAALGGVRAFAQQCEGPVITGFPSGHTTGPCWTLPLGVRVRVVTAPRPSVVIEEAPVE